MMNENIIEEEWKPKINPWIAVIPTILAAFMFVLDSTIANVALPYMAGSFSISRQESMWILTSYLIASGIIIPMIDWFSKFFGRKTFFIISVIIFTFASFLCGISHSIEMMIVSRVLQGIGGGGLLPISQAMLIESFDKDKRGLVMSLFGLVVIIAPIIGPVLGGWITTQMSWPFIFFINVPIGIITVMLVKMFIEDPPYARKQKHVKSDKTGFAFLFLWLVPLQIVLDKGNDVDWFSTGWVCWLTAISVLCGIFFFISQLKNKDSLVNLSVFKNKNFLIGTSIQVITQAVLLASVAILPQFLQSLMGYDAFLSGLSMMPRGLGSLCAMAVCAILSNLVDNRFFVVIGLTMLGVGAWMLGDLNLQISPMNIAVPNFLYGIGLGLSIIPIINLSYLTLENEQVTNASGLQNLMKNLGGAIGMSIVTTLISRFSQCHQNMMVQNLTPLNPQYAERLSVMGANFTQYTDSMSANYMAQYSMYGSMIKQSTLFAFIDSFRIFAVACFIVIPFVFLLQGNKTK